MSNPFINPTLADLRQDIAGTVPVDLILAWATSGKTEETHRTLLAPFAKSGTVVCSDSAGLSKLSSQKALFEVMKLVSQPKEIIHAHGSAIGGRAIGVWSADNTQMFYDDTISSEQVVLAMIQAQKHISSSCAVQVGMGIHYGSYYDFGGGLFGAEAAMIEHVAEEETKGGEILLSQAVVGRATNLKSAFVPHTTQTGFFTCDHSSFALEAMPKATKAYPYPFSEAFYRLMSSEMTMDEVSRALTAFEKKQTVVFLKVRHKEATFLLDQLTQWTFGNAVIKEVLKNYPEQLVKSNGDIGIFVFDDATQAFACAEDLVIALGVAGFGANVGITHGDVLLFELSDTSKEIAGGPVNIASKLSEEVETSNEIHVHETVAYEPPDGEEFIVTRSGVELKGKKYRLD